MMNVQFSSQFFFRNSAIKTFIMLFFPDNFTDNRPAFSVVCPSSLPRWIIFETPIYSFPISKTSFITKELFLSSLFSHPQFPYRNLKFCPTKSANYRRRFYTFFPSNIKAMFCTTRLRTKNIFSQHSVSLNLENFSAITTLNKYFLRLRVRIYSDNKFGSTGHGTKPSMFCRLFGKIPFSLKNFSTLSTFKNSFWFGSHKG